MATKVKIETFMPSGKWYDEIEFTTKTPITNGPQIIEECRLRAQKGMSFTFEAHSEKGGMIKRLVIVSEKTTGRVCEHQYEQSVQNGGTIYTCLFCGLRK